MGTCCAQTIDEHTKYINQKLDQEDKNDQRTNKLLFLGPGGSGKSTIFKQLQWLHGGGFGKEDALMLKEHIYCQITSQMKAAIKHYLLAPMHNQSQPKPVINNQDMLGMHPNDPINTHTTQPEPPEPVTASTYDVQKLQTAISIVQNHGDVTIFNHELAESIKYIWKHEKKIEYAFQNMETVKNKILDETTEYFFNEIDRVKVDDYIPNEADIINVRYRTTGVIEKKFEINNARFHIYDVGGQKSERKKWINCFNEVKAIIFVISLSCFNEMMYEDLNNNCMVDSLELFDLTINNKYFTDTHIILFLNKRDLYRKKISKIPITVCPSFKDFASFNHPQSIHSNPNDYEQTTCYIRWRFEALNKSGKRKQIYTHLTCAMDKKNIENVFNDVKHIIISQNLFNEGLS